MPRPSSLGNQARSVSTATLGRGIYLNLILSVLLIQRRTMAQYQNGKNCNRDVIYEIIKGIPL